MTRTFAAVIRVAVVVVSLAIFAGQDDDRPSSAKTADTTNRQLCPVPGFNSR